jgi:cob(I)alamin adenosyltransferase
MSKFYTKTGDDGYTGLLGEGRTPKFDLRIETIGMIDEANASIGFARSICTDKQTATILLVVQRDLYHIMTEIAVLPKNLERFSHFQSDRITWLEAQIDELANRVVIPSEFIVLGDTQPGAALDLARAVVRRAERSLSKLIHHDMIENKEILRYFNRLSSLCFMLELLENQSSGQAHPTFAKQ